MSALVLDAITLDAELQPRAAINRHVLENYVQLMVDGTTFPPVVVFREASTLWLADGFHRWHAHKVLEADYIDAEIVDGSRRDALLWSLSANATHGLQRASTDYRRAYDIACRNGLVVPTDSEGVAALLRCTVRWATELTEQARAFAKAERAAEIARLKGEGKSNREVAREVGLSHEGVAKIHSGNLRNASESCQSAEQPASPQPSEPPAWVQTLDDLNSPAALRWSAALRALRDVTAQASVDELFAERFTKFDHVVEEELTAAHAWIGAFYERFFDERDQRRRA